MKELERNKTKFFQSENHNDTLNVIRPYFIEFILELYRITDDLFVILYVNDVNKNDSAAIDELASILTFITMHCDRHFDEKKLFKFHLLLSEDINQQKSLSYLMNFCCLDWYDRVIIVDHKGLSAWNFKMESNLNITRLEPKIIPIQPELFSLADEQKFNQNVNDRYFFLLSMQIFRYCWMFPRNINFVDNWIQSVGGVDPVLRVESVYSEFSASQPFFFHLPNLM
eukprot:UN13294